MRLPVASIYRYCTGTSTVSNRYDTGILLVLLVVYVLDYSTESSTSRRFICVDFISVGAESVAILSQVILAEALQISKLDHHPSSPFGL